MPVAFRVGRLRRALLPIVFSLGSASTAIVSASELDGVLVPCGKEVCPWVKTKAAAPKGWVEAKDWTERYRAVFFFLGGDQGSDKPLIYVRTHLAEATIQLEDYVKDAQGKWKGAHEDSAIEPQADVGRAGKPTFKVFLYKNPSVPEQAFELTAFVKDTDPSHGNRTYFQQVVLVAPSQEVLDAARSAFEDLLGRL